VRAAEEYFHGAEESDDMTYTALRMLDTYPGGKTLLAHLERKREETGIIPRVTEAGRVSSYRRQPITEEKIAEIGRRAMDDPEPTAETETPEARAANTRPVTEEDVAELSRRYGWGDDSEATEEPSRASEAGAEKTPEASSPLDLRDGKSTIGRSLVQEMRDWITREIGEAESTTEPKIEDSSPSVETSETASSPAEEVKAAKEPKKIGKGRVEYRDAGEIQREVLKRSNRLRGQGRWKGADARALIGLSILLASYSKLEDEFAHGQIAELAHMHGTNVGRALRRAHDLGLIEYRAGDGRGTRSWARLIGDDETEGARGT
jgi:hypothetical protein